jgi:hypothetical protein
MGDIPAKTKMVSSTIIFPPTGGKAIASDTDFNITVQMANIVAGSFTNPDETYYAGPQFLQDGTIVGHTHVTVQDMGNSLNPQVPLDATKFAFFKGINDAGNGKGFLTAIVAGGLPAGNYRVCTLASASNHQPVLMPVAQRGSSDDCTKFVVSGNGNVANAASDNGAKGVAAAAAVSEAVVGATNAAFESSVLASDAAAAGKCFQPIIHRTQLTSSSCSYCYCRRCRWRRKRRKRRKSCLFRSWCYCYWYRRCWHNRYCCRKGRKGHQGSQGRGRSRKVRKRPWTQTEIRQA